MPSEDTQSPKVPTTVSASDEARDETPTNTKTAPTGGDDSVASDKKSEKDRNLAIMSEVASRIGEAHNILIALSSDPSVDELSAAIGLSICLDRIGKRATAIYSGSTPNALEFLEPEKTFETSADTLQDFVIALSKDKADHLRYKLDGDYVRIYITPYKSRISEDDLEYSYGDFNIDLVLALDVANGTDLDSALREHGRIMHDASVINITTANPGKFGELEWSDKTKSCVSEMAANLLYSMGKKVPVEKEEATAFLTGIVAATEHFSNSSTTPETMQIAAKLMNSGANQQLISENITADMDNQMFSLNTEINKRDESPDSLDIKHEEDEAESSESEAPEDTSSEQSSGIPVAPSTVSAQSEGRANKDTSPELDELASVAASLAEGASVVTPSAEPKPISLTPSSDLTSTMGQPEKVVVPTSSSLSATDKAPSDYGKMLEEALAEASTAATPIATPITSAPDLPDLNSAASGLSTASVSTGPTVPDPSTINPAISAAPTINASPEINGVPEINYGALPGNETVLPPAPNPPVDPNLGPMMPPASGQLATPPLTPPIPTTLEPPVSTTPASSTEPITSPSPTIPTAPSLDTASATQPVAPSVPDPSAFKIPGM